MLADLLSALPVHSPLPFALNARPCLRLDLGAANRELHGFDPADAPAFGAWIAGQMERAGAHYAAGGYAENRALYGMSRLFAPGEGEPRTLHLGIDLWLPAATAVHAVLPGRLHSAQDNAAFGDYGPTLIFEHDVQSQRFYTLYGHLDRASLALHPPGVDVAGGAVIGALGKPAVNGGWPPHLHFQAMTRMDGFHGDHPGVCRPSERAQWLARCPDPNLLLRIEALRMRG